VFAILLKPDLLAAPHNNLVFLLLAAYGAFATALLAMRVWKIPGKRTAQVVHVLDIGFLLALSVLTEGEASPFFAIFAFFVLVAASLRWNWKAVATTAIVFALAMWGTIAIMASLDVLVGVDLRMELIRSIYVVMAGAMLAYSSGLRERRREQLAALTDWPGPDPSQTHSPNIANLLAHCARVLKANRVLVLWEEIEEPFANVTCWNNGHYEHKREMAGAFGNFVRSRRYTDLAFWTDDVRSTFASTPDGPIRVAAPIIDDALINLFNMRGVATAPFVGALARGRVFILDRSTWSNFQLQLTQILAGRIGNALDRQIMQDQAKQAAARNERVRLTRDLHDGLLQNLTAAGLQLKLAADSEKTETRERLEVVKELLSTEQRRIRDFARTVPSRPRADADIPLKASLQDVLAEAARHWNCATSLAIEPEGAKITANLCVHLSLMVAEAVANAVRHGHASGVRVSVQKTSRDLVVCICDNGHGFPGEEFSSDSPKLAAGAKGPLSLGARVQELGGRLSIKSSSAGVELQIQLPVT
jgi:signal transduction histidine kinase